MAYKLSGKRIWVAGHRGMVGSAIVRRLEQENCEIIVVGRDKLDLTDQAAVQNWMAGTRPDAVIIAAAKVGGIFANDSYPADFLYQNLMIEANIIHAAHLADVNRMLFLGSSCIYPKHAPQPIPEAALLTGPLEPTNDCYAIAKIAGVKLMQAYRKQYGRDYISALPTNIYGPGDNFDPKTSHVLPALIRKVHEAKKSKSGNVMIWGTGTPRREFLHSDDCADALTHLLKHYNGHEHVNVGSGTDISIMELTQLICDIADFKCGISHDLSKPDGTMRKLMNNDKLKAAGWRPSINLRDGISSTYHWFLQSID